MKFKGWDKIKIQTVNQENIEAIAPVIISASRSTDIPAFYGDWFMNRLREGYVKWVNPFNANQIQYISFAKTRLIVFWTKNPKQFMRHISTIDNLKYKYYFQYTLNNYERERYEPNLPSLNERIDTFIELSENIGKEKVLWRFDPLIMTDQLGINELIEKIEFIGEKIHRHTEKCVFSFIDIDYRKVSDNLKRLGINFIEFSKASMCEMAQKLQILQKKWGIRFSTCAETIDLEEYGITHNSCIDGEMIVRIFKQDQKLMKFLGQDCSLFSTSVNHNYKDKGQRKECGCIISKDIGMYNTCRHMCVYCYANSSESLVEKNYLIHSNKSESII